VSDRKAFVADLRRREAERCAKANAFRVAQKAGAPKATGHAPGVRLRRTGSR
jgi:hypothetical protein